MVEGLLLTSTRMLELPRKETFPSRSTESIGTLAQEVRCATTFGRNIFFSVENQPVDLLFYQRLSRR